MKKPILLFLLAIALSMTTSTALAQQAWVLQTGKSGITLEIVKPFIDSDTYGYIDSDNYGIPSANYYLGGLWALAPGLSLVGELPLTYYSAKVTAESTAYPFPQLPRNASYKKELHGAAIGNPLVGAAYAIPGIPFSVSVAGRIPVITGDYSEGNTFAIYSGKYADFERKDAFVIDAAPLYTSVAWKWKPGAKTSFRLMYGNKLVFSTEGKKTTNSQVINAGIDLASKRMVFRAVFMVYTIDFTEHLQNIVGFSLGAHFGRVTPGIGLRFLTGDVTPYYAHAAIDFNFTYRFED